MWGIIGLLCGVGVGLNWPGIARLWRKPPPKPGKLFANNQGKADPFAVAVGIRLVQKDGGTSPVICEWTTKKPLVYVGHEATQFVIVQPEPGRFCLMIGLENVPVELVQAEVTDGGHSHVER